MLISLCTPVMNRLADLKKTMPFRIHAAMQALPVEFCLLDYGSTDGVMDYINELSITLPEEIVLKYARYEAKHYHQAHAYNLSILMAGGEYFCLMGADTFPAPSYFEYVRFWAERGAVWMEEPRYKGAIACRYSAFVEAGGYDERFEFYGPEDRDFAARMERRKEPKAVLPKGCIGNIPTPDGVKMANYRLELSKAQSSKMMQAYYLENTENNVMTANPNGWGRWS